MGFKIQTLQHVLEGHKVAKGNRGAWRRRILFLRLVGIQDRSGRRDPHNATIMVRKGVLVSINSDSAEHARRLNTEASVKWGGLTDDEAFALVTINPAKQLKIDNRVGSLEQGKDADVVIWSHHPLSSYAIVERTYIDGIAYYDRIAEERRLTDMRKEGRPADRREAGPARADGERGAGTAQASRRNGREA